MLFNPRWNEPKPEKPDMFALDTLIGWLEQQNRFDFYMYDSPEDCLLSQYFRAMTGKAFVVVSLKSVLMDGLCSESYQPLPKGWNTIALGNSLRKRWTFGAALKRAKRLRLKVAVGNTLLRIPQLLGLT